MKSRIILFIFISAILSSCTYYEHGPMISLKSSTKRISGEWALTDVIVNDNTDAIILENEQSNCYIFSEDGSFIISSTDISRNTNMILGSWEFNNDKTILLMNIDNVSYPNSKHISEMTILRLTATELWVSDESCSNRETDFIIERRYTKINYNE